MSKKKSKQTARQSKRVWNGRLPLLFIAITITLVALVAFSTEYESYASLYDAEYIGSQACGDCHKVIYARWQESPHAKMTRLPDETSVVGDFDDGRYYLPDYAQQTELDKLPAAKMYRRGDDYYMALRRPESDEYVPFKIAYVIGYQYRQTYLTEEAGGVLRRLPLEYSVQLGEYFPYWNFQEHSPVSMADLWVQMTTLNSAWNLFCARCHTTHLNIIQKDANHTTAETSWTDNGIACEACHGPGSHHENYFAGNYVNRVVAFVNSKLRGQPTAYIANGPKLTKGQDMSVCGRCHGPDITMSTTEVYRVYEPGYSQEGRINDLSPFFKQQPLEPGRDAPTVEVWDDGDPKGVAMVFRSFIESVCYDMAEVRCYDCHDPHNNKAPVEPGLLSASAASNDYCLKCHSELADQIAEHSHHEVGTEGSFCYDCHMPREILNLATGVPRFMRTHTMSSRPDPENSEIYGIENAPNACNECHTAESATWARGWMEEWWGSQ
jgi:predicted CXXCH cytochrome family protein